MPGMADILGMIMGQGGMGAPQGAPQAPQQGMAPQGMPPGGAQPPMDIMSMIQQLGPVVAQTAMQNPQMSQMITGVLDQLMAGQGGGTMQPQSVSARPQDMMGYAATDTGMRGASDLEANTPMGNGPDDMGMGRMAPYSKAPDEEVGNMSHDLKDNELNAYESENGDEFDPYVPGDQALEGMPPEMMTEFSAARKSSKGNKGAEKGVPVTDGEAGDTTATVKTKKKGVPGTYKNLNEQLESAGDITPELMKQMDNAMANQDIAESTGSRLFNKADPTRAKRLKKEELERFKERTNKKRSNEPIFESDEGPAEDIPTNSPTDLSGSRKRPMSTEEELAMASENMGERYDQYAEGVQESELPPYLRSVWADGTPEQVMKALDRALESEDISKETYDYMMQEVTPDEDEE